MHTIASLTDYAFQPDGPVNRTKGQYRAAQHQFAVSYAETLDRPELRVDEFVRPELALYQVDPGSGKTMAYLVAAMLMIILRDKRAMICTFTRHLRDQIKGHSGHGGDAAQASDIVKQTMEENGIAHLWRPVVVEVRTSLGDVASVIIAQSIYNDSIGHERVLAGQYLAFVRDTFAAGGLPLMQDWAAMNVGLGQNPFPTINGEMVNEKGYALTPQEQMCASSEASLMVKENPSLAEIYDLITGPISEYMAKTEADMSGTDETAPADLVLTTHAMFLRNNMMFGRRALYTSNQILAEKGSNPFGAVIIDEADMVSGLAMQWTKAEVTVEDLKYLDLILAEFRKTVEYKAQTVKQRKIIRAKLDAYTTNVQDFEEYLIGQKIPERYRVVVHAYEQHALIGRVDKILKSLVSIALLGGDLGAGRRILLNRLYDGLVECSSVYNLASKSSAEAHAINYTNTQLGIRTDPLAINSQPAKAGWLPNRAWRNIKTHSYERIMFTSGTLDPHVEENVTDTLFQSFKNRIGISDKVDVITTSKVFANKTHGRFQRFVQVDPRLRTQETEDASVLASQIDLALSTPLTNGKTTFRTLVLVPSSRLKNDVVALMTSNVHKIVQGLGVKAAPLIPELVANETAVWFGHNWFGDNFIDGSQTLFERVIIARMPKTPRGEWERMNFAKSAEEMSFFDAACKTRQGYGRAIRTGTDAPELWLLDSRLPIYNKPPLGLGKRSVAQRARAVGILENPAKNAEEFQKLVNCIPRRLVDNSEEICILTKDDAGGFVLKTI